MAKKNVAVEACLFCNQSPCTCNKKPAKAKKGGKSATDGVTQGDDSGDRRRV